MSDEQQTCERCGGPVEPFPTLVLTYTVRYRMVCVARCGTATR